MFIIDSKGTLISSNNNNKGKFKNLVQNNGKPYKYSFIKDEIAKLEKKNAENRAAALKNQKSVNDVLKFQTEQVFKGKLAAGQCLVAYSPIENTDWYVVSTIPFSYLNAETNKIGVSIVIIGFICFLLSLLLSYIISKSISIPLNRLVSLMKEAKNGNLSVNINVRHKDEISEVNRNFNDMLSNISSLVSKVNTSALSVLNNSEKIYTSSEQSSVVSEQVATTIQQIAKGASEQAEETSECVNQMNKLSNDINNVGSGMKTVSGVISETKNLSENALSVVKSLSDKALETRSVSENIINDINNLNSDMKEIKKVVKVIVAIAEQTNLLSLNAAIEAARAGDAGKGFAVVADEVKKLADRSKDASITINNIINNIQHKTEQTVTAANNAGTIVNQQMEAVENTDTVFRTIFDTMEGLSRHIGNVEDSVKDILVSKEKTMEAIENISAVSEEAAATAEEVSASTQEQMASSEELSKLAKELTDMSRELSDSISMFKIKD